MCIRDSINPVNCTEIATADFARVLTSKTCGNGTGSGIALEGMGQEQARESMPVQNSRENT